jgi:precorrin-6A/cobalt-precorrin-6A reductase
MILVIGGTSEGRAIARELAGKGAGVLVSTATAYGSDLAARDGVEVVQGRLGCREMADLIVARSVRVLLDASHPFAVEVSRNAREACRQTGIRYMRYARPRSEMPAGARVEMAESYQEAASRACDLGSIIFLAAGAKWAGVFAALARDRGARVVVRAIPDPETIRGLLALGIRPEDVVALHGPFGEDLNLALLRHYRADVMVTKESGREGGLGEKISAAARLGIPVVLIRRPPEPAGAVESIPEAVATALEYIRQLTNK